VYTLAAAAVAAPASEPGATVETSIELVAGLNLVSLPIEPAETNAAVLFGGAEVYSSDTNGNHAAAATLVAGRGYWVRVAKDTMLTIAGTMPTNSTIQLIPGWNLIGLKGSYGAEGVDLKTVTGGDALLKAGLRAWDAERQVYEQPDIMLPGVGYSVYLTEPTTITMP
jgi:hypothetical protein